MWRFFLLINAQNCLKTRRGDRKVLLIAVLWQQEKVRNRYHKWLNRGHYPLLWIKKVRNSYAIRTKNTNLLLKTYNENRTNVSEQTDEHENRACFATWREELTPNTRNAYSWITTFANLCSVCLLMHMRNVSHDIKFSHKSEQTF